MFFSLTINIFFTFMNHILSRDRFGFCEEIARTSFGELRPQIVPVITQQTSVSRSVVIPSLVLASATHVLTNRSLSGFLFIYGIYYATWTINRKNMANEHLANIINYDLYWYNLFFTKKYITNIYFLLITKIYEWRHTF